MLVKIKMENDTEGLENDPTPPTTTLQLEMETTSEVWIIQKGQVRSNNLN